MTDRAHMPADVQIPNLLCYEELIADKPGNYDWPSFDERTASSLCYTSGTTGNPKGVLYSHRSTVLHRYGAGAARRARPLGARRDPAGGADVPRQCLGHALRRADGPARSWCSPAPQLDGASLYELFEKEKVTLSAGVPTVWLGLLNYMQAATSSGSRR